jgi:hypothetical protein
VVFTGADVPGAAWADQALSASPRLIVSDDNGSAQEVQFEGPINPNFYSAPQRRGSGASRPLRGLHAAYLVSVEADEGKRLRLSYLRRPCSVKDVTRESFRLDKPAAVSNRIAVTLRRIAPSEPTDTLRVPIINVDIGAPSLPHTVAERPPTARQLNSRFIRKALARDTSYRKRGGPRLSASGPKSGDASTRR